MRALAVAVAASTVVLSGCAVSLQPFYTPATILDDRSIEGRWAEDSSVWQVTRTGPGRFDVATCEPEVAEPCKPETVGVLFRTGGVTFLDFQEKSESQFSSTLRPHGLFRVERNGAGFDLTVLDADGLTKLARDARLDAEFAELEAGVMLTGKPEEMQSFALRHLSDPQVFGEPHHLERAPAVSESR